MPQLAFAALPDGHIEFLNRRWYDYAGKSPDPSVGTNWAVALLHPEDRDAFLSGWANALRSGEDFEAEHRLLAGDGRYRWFLTRAAPLRDADGGSILRWFATSTDIGEIVRSREAARDRADSMEARVAERTRALSEAAAELGAEMRRREETQAALLQSQKLEALGQLTAGVSHDFNNILSAILGSLELVERRSTEPPVLDAVVHGKNAAYKAASLTSQLLAFGRHETLEPMVLDVGDALRQANELIGHAIGVRIDRVLEIEPETWPVLTNGNQLEIALLNLAINARDAMPSGGTLTLGARNLPVAQRPADLPDGDYVVVWVKDSGEGMSPEILSQATDPFFTTKVEGKGTGLGLSMVRGFVDRSGGRLRIESHQSVGTTVEIILPRAAVTGAAGSTRIAAPPQADSDGLAGGVILLVEDDDQIRGVAAGCLRLEGYTVLEAASVEAALVLRHSVDKLDMLVTELGMPGALETNLVEQLRAERPGLPVLFITENTTANDSPDIPTLLKPFTGAELGEAVRRHIGRSIDPTAAEKDLLLQRLRSPALCAAYLFWRAARNGDRPPRLADLAWGALPEGDSSFTVAVDVVGDTVAFRYLRVGSSLIARLGRSLEGTLATDERPNAEHDEVLGSLDSAYRRSARTFAPSYEYAHYDFGDGTPVTFERLLLPVSDDGSHVTHLVGIALFDGANGRNSSLLPGVGGNNDSDQR